MAKKHRKKRASTGGAVTHKRKTFIGAANELRRVYKTMRRLPPAVSSGSVSASIDGGFTLTLKRG